MTAIHLIGLTFSPNNTIASNIVKIGFVKIIAVASVMGIMLEAPNNILIPTQPHADLPKWTL